MILRKGGRALPIFALDNNDPLSVSKDRTPFMVTPLSVSKDRTLSVNHERKKHETVTQAAQAIIDQHGGSSAPNLLLLVFYR